MCVGVGCGGVWWGGVGGERGMGGKLLASRANRLRCVVCLCAAPPASEPNIDSPLNSVAAQLWDKPDGTTAAARVARWVTTMLWDPQAPHPLL
jgi:hypothetical protein